MIRKPLKTNFQLLIYQLYWNTKVIKRLKNELALSNDDDDIYLINGNLSECKQDRITLLREKNIEIKKKKKGYFQ
jgi:hypothetical protein